MDEVIDQLWAASGVVFDAADALSDIRCDAWADHGGVGAPPSDRRIEKLYALSKAIEAVIEEL